jgi:4'-phosphopantetheinyl transferase
MSQQQACDARPGTLERQLSRQDVHLYFSWPEEISDPALLSRYESLLSADERERMSRFHFARNRHQYLITRALIRASLSTYYPLDPGAWQFSQNRYGKPEISHPDVSLPIRFNLSHTHGLTVCAIAHHCDIGVDVEDSQRSTHAGFRSLGSYFSSQEIDDLAKVPEDQQRQRFFDYWTLKESYIKARGLGLAIPLDKFSFLFEANQLKGFSVHPDLQDDADCWQFWRIAIAGQYGAGQCGADQHRTDPHGADQYGADRYPVALAIKSKNREHEITAFNSVPLCSNVPFALSFPD